MVIQESPYETEWKRQKYMGGKGGKMFKTALSEIGLSDEDVYYTSIVKYPTPDDRLPLPEEVKESRDLLFAEIEVIEPEVIIPTGNMSMKAVIGEVAITKQRGKLVEKNGLRFFPMIHPNMALKQPKYMDFFAKDIMNLYAILEGEKPEGVESFELKRRYCDTYTEAIDEVNRLIALPSGSLVVIDLETVKANPFIEEVFMTKTMREKYPDSSKPKIVGIGFSDEEGYGSAIPMYHRQTPFSGNQLGTIVKTLRVLMEREDLQFSAHNGKFDLKWLRAQLRVMCSTLVWDTMVLHYLLITEERGTHGLKDLTWLETNMGGYDDELDKVKPKGDNKGNYDLVEWDILKRYLATDCDVSFRILKKYKSILEGDSEKKWIYDYLMVPGYYTLLDIEMDGIKVDLEWLNVLKEAYPKEIERLEDKLRQYPEVLEIEREYKSRWAERCAIGKIKKMDRTDEQQKKFQKWEKYNPSKGGQSINFGSNAQLGVLLFEKMGLETVILTDKGNPSVSEESLTYMKDQHPIIQLLMEYNKVKHLNSNFVAGMEELLDPDGFVHPSYNIHGTVTGRLSSNEPNAQQFPRKVYDPFLFQYNYEIKKLFSSRFDDGLIVQFDYSQLELRILAVFSQDENLLKLYNSGADLHTAVAADAFGVTIEEVTKTQRTAAKKIQFGIVYQESAQGLSEDLRAEGIDMSVDECQRFINNYFKRYPGVKKWISSIKMYAKRNKHVKSLVNRVRNLPTIDSTDRSLANEAERQAVNAPIQSTGSDCTLMSLIVINKWLRETGKRSRICITVHDSIVLDCPKDEVKEVATKVKHIMENLAEYNEFYSFLGDVPIVSEMEIGYNYADAFEYEGNIEDLNIEEFIQSNLDSVAKKEQEAFRKAEEEGTPIPKHVRTYWEAS